MISLIKIQIKTHTINHRDLLIFFPMDIQRNELVLLLLGKNLIGNWHTDWCHSLLHFLHLSLDSAWGMYGAFLGHKMCKGWCYLSSKILRHICGNWLHQVVLLLGPRGSQCMLGCQSGTDSILGLVHIYNMCTLLQTFLRNIDGTLKKTSPDLPNHKQLTVGKELQFFSFLILKDTGVDNLLRLLLRIPLYNHHSHPYCNSHTTCNLKYFHTYLSKEPVRILGTRRDKEEQCKRENPLRQSVLMVKATKQIYN